MEMAGLFPHRRNGDGIPGQFRQSHRVHARRATSRVQPGTTVIDSRLFQLMVEQTQDYALFLLDDKGHVTSWNRGAQRIKGYAAEEIIGRHFSVFYGRDAVDRGWPDYEL